MLNGNNVREALANMGQDRGKPANFSTDILAR